MNKRINWIDWVKVIAITLVVLGHTKFEGNDIYVQYFIYNFHMPLFLFISGYLFKNTVDFKSFFKKNTDSLLIPYLLLNFIVFVITLVLHIPAPALKKQIFTLIIGIGDNMPSVACWFVYCLFVIRLIAHCVLKLKWKIQLIVIMSFPILSYVLIETLHIPTTFTITNSLYGIVFFIVGYYFRKYNFLENLKFYLKFCFFIISLIFLVMLTYFQNNVDLYTCRLGTYPLLYYPVSFIGIFMVIMLSMLLNNINSKVITTLSAGTLLILAFHIIIANYIFPRIITKIFGQFDYCLVYYLLSPFIIVLLFYYPTIFIKKYFPVLIGNRR